MPWGTRICLSLLLVLGTTLVSVQGQEDEDTCPVFLEIIKGEREDGSEYLEEIILDLGALPSIMEPAR